MVSWSSERAEEVSRFRGWGSANPRLSFGGTCSQEPSVLSALAIIQNMKMLIARPPLYRKAAKFLPIEAKRYLRIVRCSKGKKFGASL